MLLEKMHLKSSWKAFGSSSFSTSNGDDPLWAVVTFPNGSYTIDGLYTMTEKGTSWRIFI